MSSCYLSITGPLDANFELLANAEAKINTAGIFLRNLAVQAIALISN